jgi:hypothetical protein
MIENYDWEIEKRYHPENFDDIEEKEVDDMDYIEEEL